MDTISNTKQAARALRNCQPFHVGGQLIYPGQIVSVDKDQPVFYLADGRQVKHDPYLRGDVGDLLHEVIVGVERTESRMPTTLLYGFSATHQTSLGVGYASFDLVAPEGETINVRDTPLLVEVDPSDNVGLRIDDYGEGLEGPLMNVSTDVFTLVYSGLGGSNVNNESNEVFCGPLHVDYEEDSGNFEAELIYQQQAYPFEQSRLSPFTLVAVFDGEDMVLYSDGYSQRYAGVTCELSPGNSLLIGDDGDIGAGPGWTYAFEIWGYPFSESDAQECISSYT